MSSCTLRPFLNHTFNGPSVFLVVADGPSLLDDLDRFYTLDCDPTEVCCINNSVQKYQNITCSIPHYNYSWHEDKFKVFSPHSRTLKVSCSYDVTGILKSEEQLKTPGIMWVALSSTRGSSTLQAVRFGLEILEMDKIVVVGAPLTGWYGRFSGEWGKLKEKNRVKAFCGNGVTELLLGTPTQEWIKGD